MALAYLVALDSSARARAVLDRAVSLAQTTRAKLVLFRVEGLPSDLPVEAYATSPDGVIGLLRQRAERDLNELAKAIPGSVAFEILVEIGAPCDAICAAAGRLAVDLIVLGSHGYSGVDRLLGTTAARVVNHADCSVLVVRPSPSPV